MKSFGKETRSILTAICLILILILVIREPYVSRSDIRKYYAEDYDSAQDTIDKYEKALELSGNQPGSAPWHPSPLSVPPEGWTADFYGKNYALEPCINIRDRECNSDPMCNIQKKHCSNYSETEESHLLSNDELMNLLM